MPAPTPPNPFDRASRGLVRRFRLELLAWLLGVPNESLRFVRWIDTHLSIPGQPERVCDLVAHVLRDDMTSLPWANPIEFQVTPDGLMFGRLMVYEGMIWLQEKPNKLPGDRFSLQSVVVNLTGVGKSGRTMPWKAGLGTSLEPVEWDLETFDGPDVLECIARGEAPRGLLAWISLMKKGNEEATIRRWLEIADTETDPVKKADFALVVVFAQLTGHERTWQKALEGFNVIESVIVNEWKAQAAVKSKIEDVIVFLEGRFGPLPVDAKATIESTSSLEVLSRWIRLSSKANSLDEFRQAAGL